MANIGDRSGSTVGISFAKACFNGINSFLGIGMLTIPYAVSNGGWVSMILFVLVAATTYYTANLLRKCMDVNPDLKSYTDIAGYAFGKRGKVIVYAIANLELYLIAVGFLILESQTLEKIFPHFVVKIGSRAIRGRKSFVLITALAVLPPTLTTDMGRLSYVSATGVLACCVILVSIFCVGAFGGVGFRGNGSLFNLVNLPTAVSLYIACFGGHPVIPSIYASMTDKRQFTKVLIVTFAVSTVGYLVALCEGYLMYGDSMKSQIMLNLPTDQLAAKVALYSTLVIPVAKYALMVSPVAEALEAILPRHYQGRLTIKLLVRTGLLVSSTIIAFVFPHFESLMAILGCIFINLATFVIPCLCHLKIAKLWRTWSVELAGLMMIIALGAVTGILGTIWSVRELIRNYVETVPVMPLKSIYVEIFE